MAALESSREKRTPPEAQRLVQRGADIENPLGTVSNTECWIVKVEKIVRAPSCCALGYRSGASDSSARAAVRQFSLHAGEGFPGICGALARQGLVVDIIQQSWVRLETDDDISYSAGLVDDESHTLHGLLQMFFVDCTVQPIGFRTASLGEQRQSSLDRNRVVRFPETATGFGRGSRESSQHFKDAIEGISGLFCEDIAS